MIFVYILTLMLSAIPKNIAELPKFKQKPQEHIEISIREFEWEIKPNFDDLEPMRVTCYTWTGNHMANGEYPYYGACAYRSDMIGGTATLYTLEGELIGTFDIKDTGGYYIANGYWLDIYQPTLEECYEWVAEYGDYLYVVFEKGE